MLMTSGRHKFQLHSTRNVLHVANHNRRIKSYQSHFVFLPAEFLILLEELKDRVYTIFTYVNDEIQRNLEAKRKRESLFLHRIVNFSDTLSSTILSLPA